MTIPSYERSFASHEKAKYWSKKNGDVKPNDVYKGSSKTKYWFDCDKCPHEFDITLNNIANNRWCPYCSNKNLCDNAKCDDCLKKSFASHPKAIHWSNTKNDDVKPRDVFQGTHNKYWFDCDKCNHNFETSLYNISKVNGIWCPYCSVPPKKLCNNARCDDCLKKSFASHPKAIHWNKTENGDVKPRDLFQGTRNKYWFDCDKCKHTFDAALSHIRNGRWCPYCKNKTEQKLYDAVKPLYPTLITQLKQEWCKNICCLPFDFCIPEHNIIIELDGPQHFRQVSNWLSQEETFENDLFKQKCANDNGYSVIRILQEDVLGDKYDWLSKLQTEIENIIKDDTIIHNIYMCENGEYDNFMIE